MIPLVLCGIGRRDSQKAPCLVNRKPVAEPHAEALGSFNPPNAGGQVWIEEPIVRRLIGKPPHRCQSEVDRGGGKATTFQFIAVAQNDCPSEGQPGF